MTGLRVSWEHVEQVRHTLSHRAARRITQAQFARLLGMSLSGINDWRPKASGTPYREVPASAVACMAALLALPPAELAKHIEQVLSTGDALHALQGALNEMET